MADNTSESNPEVTPQVKTEDKQTDDYKWAVDRLSDVSRAKNEERAGRITAEAELDQAKAELAAMKAARPVDGDNYEEYDDPHQPAPLTVEQIKQASMEATKAAMAPVQDQFAREQFWATHNAEAVDVRMEVEEIAAELLANGAHQIDRSKALALVKGMRQMSAEQAASQQIENQEQVVKQVNQTASVVERPSTPPAPEVEKPWEEKSAKEMRDEVFSDPERLAKIFKVWR